MDSERIITGSIILLIIIIPIALLKAKSFFKRRKIVRTLYLLAEKNNETIRQCDHWNNSAIGLTETGKRVFIVSNGQSEIKSQMVDLTLYKKCVVINDNSNAPYKEGNFKVTDNIILELTGPNNSKEQIGFYNMEKDGPLLTDELQFAEKWCKLVNDSFFHKTVNK